MTSKLSSLMLCFCYAVVESIRILEGVLSSLVKRPSGHVTSNTGSPTTCEEIRHEDVPGSSVQIDEHPSKRRKTELDMSRVGATSMGQGRDEAEVELIHNRIYLFGNLLYYFKASRTAIQIGSDPPMNGKFIATKG